MCTVIWGCEKQPAVWVGIVGKWREREELTSGNPERVFGGWVVVCVCVYAYVCVESGYTVCH